MKDSIQLSRLMLVTRRQQMKPNFETALEVALRGGARLIQLREKELPCDELWELAHQAQNLCEKYGARLLINGESQMAQQLGVGLHLPEATMCSEGIEGEYKLCGVSTHSLESARRAVECGADYLVFGSVFETASHPGEAPAGLDELQAVCKAVSLPVFAIGGVTARNATECLKAGAYGVAVIGAAWNAENGEGAVKQLLDALEGGLDYGQKCLKPV